MLNLIDMNLTRFFKTKALYVTSVITFLLIFLIAFNIGGADFVGITNEMTMGLTLAMVGIFATVYSDEERKSGFLKNLETSKAKKGNVFLSKIPVIALFSFIIILVAFAATAVGLMRDPANFASLNIFNLIIFIAIQVFLHTAFGTGFMAIYEMARGLVAPLVLSFVFAGGTHLLILNSITAKIAEAVPALGNIFESIIAPTEFSVVTLSKYMKLGEIGTPYIKVMLLGAGLLVVYTILGSTIFRKRDTF